jgi:phospholipase C
MRRAGVAAFALSILAAACSGGRPAGLSTASFVPAFEPATLEAAGRPFHHIVIEIQENRSFDNVYAGAAIAHLLAHGVDYAAWGYNDVCKNPRKVDTCGQVPLSPLGYESPYDPDHYQSYLLGECNAPKTPPKPREGTSPCRMNGWEQEQFSPSAPPGDATIAYSYLPPAEIGPYVQLANSYALADEMFSGARSPSFPGHVFLVSGLGPADDSQTSTNWGCPQASDTVPLFAAWTPGHKPQTVSQCFKYRSLVTLLDARGISWKYYNDQQPGTQPYCCSDLENGLAAFQPVYASPDYSKRVVPRADFFADVQPVGSSRCGLPAVSWLTPNGDASDHAGWENNADGPYWIATVYEAIAQSPCYRDTAFIVIWDDSGGWFDHVPPPYVLTRPPSGLLGYRDDVVGFRVPMLFIAPNAVRSASHKRRDFGAILRFVERNFGLPPLGGEDLDFGGDALQDMYVPHPKATITPIPTAQIMIRARKPYGVRWFLDQPSTPADDE